MLNFDIAGLLAPFRMIFGNQCCDWRLVPIEFHGRINDGTGVVESPAFGDEDLHVHLTARCLVLMPTLRNRDRGTVVWAKLSATITHEFRDLGLGGRADGKHGYENGSS